MAAPGWYLDPKNHGVQRYWDGQQWTAVEPVSPPPVAPPVAPKKSPLKWLLIGGAVLFLAVTCDRAMSTSSKHSPDAAGPSPTTATATATATAPTPSIDVEALNRFESAYIDDDASTQALWQRSVALLREQADVALDPIGNVNLAIVINDKRAVLHRDDLGMIGYTVCSDASQRVTAAKTVGWMTEAYELPNRWVGAQLRTAALETKCPTLNR